MTMLEHALEYAAAGFPVFPLVPGEKKPATPGGLHDATTKEEIIRRWWGKLPNANIGIPMGRISGLLGLDIDYKDGARADFLSSIPVTVIQKSPSGGHHAFFKYPDSPIKNNKRVEQGVTVRSDGYYFAVAPSVFNGANYSWERRGIVDGELLDVPGWIMSIQDQKKPKASDATIGERHDALVNRATFLRKLGKDKGDVVHQLFKLNSKFKDGPKDKSEVLKVVDWAWDNVKVIETDSESFNSENIHIAPFPDENEKGKRLGTINNFRELLRRLKIVVRYNVISKKEEILIPDFHASMDNHAAASFGEILSWCERCYIPSKNIDSYLTHIADENQYNPVATWIESVPWDGQSRLQDLYDTIKSTDEQLKEIVMRRWLISAVAAAYEPSGVSAHGVLVFKGKQYLGKTMWFKSLVPEAMGALADGQFLRPDDKDSVFQVLQHWINELGELDATFRKSDISQLKAFLTKNKDMLRTPYARKVSEYPRRTVFFGSVNETDFLKDQTGNRRFWTVECLEIDFKHPVDMQQLWAEVRMLYLAGEPWVLSGDEMELLNKHNEDFEELDPIRERIEMSYNFESTFRRWASATEVCLDIGILNPSKRDTNSAARVLRQLNCRRQPNTKRFEVPHCTRQNN